VSLEHADTGDMDAVDAAVLAQVRIAARIGDVGATSRESQPHALSELG
jgi:hypothetical protein